MMGRSLQKSYNNHEKWVLTTPIINGTDGRKMSKSYGNFVALTENPNDMYGKLMSIGDDLIVEYFTLLTDLEMSEIEDMENAIAAGTNPMEFKKKLAHTITKMYHNVEDANAAAEHFKTTVQDGGVPSDIETLTVNGNLLDAISEALPEISKSQLRRLSEQGAISINDEKVDLMAEHSFANGDILKVGKRNFFKLKK